MTKDEFINTYIESGEPLIQCVEAYQKNNVHEGFMVSLAVLTACAMLGIVIWALMKGM